MIEKRLINHKKQIQCRRIANREWDNCLEPTNFLPLQGKLWDVWIKCYIWKCGKVIAFAECFRFLGIKNNMMPTLSYFHQLCKVGPNPNPVFQVKNEAKYYQLLCNTHFLLVPYRDNPKQLLLLVQSLGSLSNYRGLSCSYWWPWDSVLASETWVGVFWEVSGKATSITQWLSWYEHCLFLLVPLFSLPGR